MWERALKLGRYYTSYKVENIQFHENNDRTASAIGENQACLHKDSLLSGMRIRNALEIIQAESKNIVGYTVTKTLVDFLLGTALSMESDNSLDCLNLYGHVIKHIMHTP
jgi:hypothetical protein